MNSRFTIREVSREHAFSYKTNQYVYQATEQNIEDIHKNHIDNYHGPCVLEIRFPNRIEYHEIVHELEPVYHFQSFKE